MLKGFFNLFYPKRCRVCGNFSKSILCLNCKNSFSLIEPPICKRCGKPCNIEVNVCRDCRNRFKFSTARSLGFYEGALKNAIHEFKYRNGRGLARIFASLMAGMIDDFEDVDLITYVPLSRKKQLKRGYNQAYLLAREIAKKTGLICDSILIRINEETDQTKLSPEQRKRNVRRAFIFDEKKSISGKSLLLIDDVFTTGSTVDECSKVLYAKGAKKVSVLTIARVCNI